MPGRADTTAMRHRWPEEKLSIPEPSKAKANPGNDLELEDGHTTQLILTKEDVTAHLCLLGAFKQLCNDIASYEGPDMDVLKGADAFSVYVAKAVWRADRWFRSLSSEDLQDRLPPPDVLLVWHSYLLNPRKYFEDATRWNRTLLNIGDLPLGDIVGTIDPATYAFRKADRARAENFTKQTSLPFDLERPRRSDTVDLTCPCCDGLLRGVSWWREDATGYGQSAFKETCSNCNREITRAVLGLRKLLNDIEEIRKDPQTNTLAQMFASPKYGLPTPESRKASAQVNGVLASIEASGAGVFDWDASRLRPFIQKLVGGTRFDDSYFVDRCCRSYSYPEQFSVDMRGAVMRQQGTISDVYDLQWSTPQHPRLTDKILIKVLRSYHMALEFLREKPDNAFVPTLVLDLGWHTHLLFHQSYRTSTLQIIGAFLEHDDDVELDELYEPFAKTKESWKNYFGTDYCFEFRWDENSPRPDMEWLAKEHEISVRWCVGNAC